MTYRVHIAFLGREQSVLVDASRHVAVLFDDGRETRRLVRFLDGPRCVAEFPASIVISISES